MYKNKTINVFANVLQVFYFTRNLGLTSEIKISSNYIYIMSGSKNVQLDKMQFLGSDRNFSTKISKFTREHFRTFHRNIFNSFLLPYVHLLQYSIPYFKITPNSGLSLVMFNVQRRQTV